MFNITYTGSRVDISSSGVDFRITGSLVSGTSFMVADIEAIGYDWEVTYSGTVANVKLISQVVGWGSCFRTQTDALFAVPTDYTAPPDFLAKFLLVSGTSALGFLGQGDYVYYAPYDAVSRANYDGTVPETKTYTEEDYKNFVLAENGQVIIETYDVDSNYDILLKDFGGDIGDKILFSIDGYVDVDDTYPKNFQGMCITSKGKIVSFLTADYTGVDGWVVEVHIHNLSGVELLSWTETFETNYSIQSSPPAPVLVGDVIYWGIGWLSASTSTSISTGIILKVDTANLSVSYIRPMNGSYCSGAIYCGAYDATLGKVAFIFDSVVGLGGSREAGVFLIDSALSYSIEHLQAYTYPTYVDEVPQGLIQGKTEAFVLHHNGYIISLSSLNQTTITAGLTNMQYAMPRYCCNIVDDEGYIWTVEGSGGNLVGYSVLAAGRYDTGIAIPAGIIYIYLNNGHLLVRNATFGAYNLWVMK